MGAVCSTMTCASGASRYRSTARLSGRAPSSGEKPRSTRNVERRLVVLDRPRPSAQAAPSSTWLSSFSSSARICSRAKRPEDDDAVEAVEELGPERLRDDPLDPLGAEGRSARRSKPTADPRAMAEPTFDVRMKTQWRKSTFRALEVGEAAVVEDLEEQVPDPAAAFSNSSSRTTANGSARTDVISEDAGCVAARVRQQPLEAVGRLELAHVEPDQPRGRAEQVLGERLGELGLAGAGRADEQEDAQRAGRVGEAGLEQAIARRGSRPPRAGR